MILKTFWFKCSEAVQGRNGKEKGVIRRMGGWLEQRVGEEERGGRNN